MVITDVERKARLAYAIAEAMRRRRLTPPKVAKMVGKNADTIRRWASGETAPSALDVEPLAYALGVDVAYLVTPPPVPDYPLDEYLVHETVEDAMEEGFDRADQSRERGGE